MKKVLCIVLAILICASLAFPVLAAEFVPSITYKGSPSFVSKKDDAGKVSVGAVVMVTEGAEEAEEEELVYEGCLRVTPVAKAKTLPEAERDLLLKVYKELSDGTMVLPYDKVEGINADKMVIRELMDVALVCDHEHATKLKEENVVIRLAFDLGVAKDAKLAAMTYVNDEWVPAVELVNNGDGTVSCTFEDLCPVVFAIEA